MEFYSNSVPMLAGIAFTMLGFGIASLAILASVIATPAIVRLRHSTLWANLIAIFTRGNIIFLGLGLFGLFAYKEIVIAKTLLGDILRAGQMILLGATAMAAVIIITVLHAIVSTPLTPEEKHAVEAEEFPNFAAPIEPTEALPPRRVIEIEPHRPDQNS
ncbi:hypothetical protein GCM10010844_07690 [Deinococcus radiotolerans]|uniref:Cation:proton antiporter n=2 Tax=Deinococcus radiotolerans TaxID=1309407 RepID=A0ABQ2FEX5_9DEIO|nr:hypothetical protein GCM10010844_07690 [Deinococcus radiotolerans]